MDVHTKSQRSFNMSRIKGENTKPELILRRLLWASGFRYRLHSKKLPGCPDIVFNGRKKVVFVNGCFWHMHDCKFFKWPKANPEFWDNKIHGNVLRDLRNYALLLEHGWNYFVVWECETKGDTESLMVKIKAFLLS